MHTSNGSSRNASTLEVFHSHAASNHHTHPAQRGRCTHWRQSTHMTGQPGNGRLPRRSWQAQKHQDTQPGTVRRKERPRPCSGCRPRRRQGSRWPRRGHQACTSRPHNGIAVGTRTRRFFPQNSQLVSSPAHTVLRRRIEMVLPEDKTAGALLISLLWRR